MKSLPEKLGKTFFSMEILPEFFRKYLYNSKSCEKTFSRTVQTLQKTDDCLRGNEKTADGCMLYLNSCKHLPDGTQNIVRTSASV